MINLPLNLHLVTIHAMPSPQAVPLAAACLKSFLDSVYSSQNPLHVTCSEYFSGTPLDEICKAILCSSPDIVGFSIYLWNRADCCNIAFRLKEAAPHLKLMAGGPEVTADPESILIQAPFDFLVVGEGELTVAEAMDCLASGGNVYDLPGIARIVAGRPVITRRPPIADLSILPSPWLTGILDSHIQNGVVWQLSRGCSFGCDFCYDGMGDRKVRRYPLERLEAELDYFVAHGVSQIFVLDSTFNQDVKRAKTLLRLIAEKAPQVHCHFEVRHELLDEEQARLFSELTCSLQIGLQSADPDVAANVGRKFNREDLVRKVSFLNDHGAIFGFDLIYGLPGDTIAKFRDGLDFALSLYPNHLDIFPLSVLPGTRVAESAANLGLVHLPVPPYTLLESPTFPASDMEAARRLGAACDIFYSRGKAVAWFNGILSAVRMKTVSFLEEFAEWLLGRYGSVPDEVELGDARIWKLQRDFISAIFNKKKAARFIPLALDFVDYHYHYAAAVMAPSPVGCADQQVHGRALLNLPLFTADSARLARFSYEILDLLEAGEPDLPELFLTLEPTGSTAVIYPKGGDIFTESLAESYYNLLKRLDRTAPVSLVAAELKLPDEEVIEFLEFALEEGIVTI